jgi:hypothetical protein
MNSKTQVGEVRSGVPAERRHLSETSQRRSTETPLRRIIIEVKP